MARNAVTSTTHSTTAQVQVLTTVTTTGECPWAKAQASLGKAPRTVTVHEDGVVHATAHDDHRELIVGKL